MSQTGDSAATPPADEASERAFLSSLTSGRAVLLLGQNHDPRLIDQLLTDIAAALRTERAADIRAQLVGHVGPSDLPNVRRAVTLHSSPDELVELAVQPWSYVMTTAVDSIALDAFRRAGSSGRRLRILFPSQAMGQLAKRAADALTVIRLFGSLDEEEERYQPPLTQLALRRRRSFEVAAVLQELPALLGPRGSLAVVGVSEGDWLDLDDLALACSQLPPQSVHWFGRENPMSEHPDVGDALVWHSGSVSNLLKRHQGTAELAALEDAQIQLARPAAHTIQLGVGGPALRLAPEEWRNVAQVGVLLDDTVTNAPAPLSPEEERDVYRAFLRHPQHIPDWEGISRGFLFERDVGTTVLPQIEDALARLGSVRESAGGPSSSRKEGGRIRSRLPILLTGPPAAGKSRLLHWLAFQLRVRGHVVLYLLTPAGRVHYESVERACRILEGKGAPSVLVFADGLDDTSYTQLNEHLTSTGRNAQVVGTRSGFQLDDTRDDPRLANALSQYRAAPVPPRLSQSEFARFQPYLAARGHEAVAISEDHVRDRYFLLLLYRLLPDARGSIHLSLTSEYDRLLAALDTVQLVADTQDPPSSWSSQLQVLKAVLYPEWVEPITSQGTSVLTYSTETEGAINLCLFCAQIGKPLPIDLLLRTQGAGFLRRYRDFAAVIESTALLQEVESDNTGTLVLDADHPVIAQLTLASVMPRRSDQLRLLAPFIDAVTWDDAAFPGDRPDQDYGIEVLQAIGPRGVAEREFQAPQTLEVLAGLLERVRSDHGTAIPKLLLLEANTLRLLADRVSTDHEIALRRCEEALAVLDSAEEVLMRRRPTTARNSELRNVLNTRAAVHGFMIGNYLREYKLAERSSQVELRQLIFAGLDEVERLAARSRGLGGPSFYPLDVTFWVYRDTLDQLPDLRPDERVRLLERMEEVLDSAQDEPIETTQFERYKRRAVNLAQLSGDAGLSQQLAAVMRENGDFSGECLLVRGTVFEPGTRTATSPAAAEAGLRRLEEFGLSAFASKEALDLMHRLWMAAHLPPAKIGGPDPVFAACNEAAWTRWRRILEARTRLVGSGQNLFLGFCLSWTMFQLGEPRLGLQEIRAVEPLSSGSTRRVGCLTVLTHPDGQGIRYRGSVRRREGDTLVLYASALLSEVRLPPTMTTRFAVLPDVGDEVEMEIGLNYRGLLPWRLA